jgi:uncharacterized protein YbjT (DUF2867 family)
MILVAGATGLLGSEICRRLVAAGHAVRGLVRRTSNPTTVERLRALGVDLAEGDLRDRASLDAACRGVRTVVSTATTTLSRQPGDSIEGTDRDGQLALVEAAVAAGAQQFVLVSYSGRIPEADPLTRAKRTVERRVKESGMTYTILRPSIFMEVWLSPALGFDYPAGRVTLYGSARNPISWVSLGDVAAMAVASVEHPAACNAVIEFGGPEPVAPLEVVKRFEHATGRDIEVQLVPEEALAEQRRTATDSLQEAFAALMTAYARGDVHDAAGVQRTFGMRFRTLDDYIAQCAGALAPA